MSAVIVAFVVGLLILPTFALGFGLAWALDAKRAIDAITDPTFREFEAIVTFVEKAHP